LSTIKKYTILNYSNGIVNAQVAAIAFAHTIIKCIFFGIVAVTAITIVSFEVFPLTAVPLVTIRREGQSIVGPTIDNIIYGKLEDEHTIGLVTTTTVATVFKQTINNMEYFQISKNNNNYNNNKLVHQGFRIKKAVLNMLDTEAKKKGISLSNLVNKILENHVTCDMYFEELGFIPVSKDFLRKVFGRIEEEEEEDVQNYLIDDSRELGLIAAKEYIPYFYSESNGDTLVQFLDKWFCKFQCHQHRVDNDNNYNNRQHHYFIVNHDINMNFSIALKAFLEALIEPIIKRPVKFNSLTQNAISFSFETLPEPSGFSSTGKDL
jgi:hypothetical protein